MTMTNMTKGCRINRGHTITRDNLVTTSLLLTPKRRLRHPLNNHYGPPPPPRCRSGSSPPCNSMIAALAGELAHSQLFHKGPSVGSLKCRWLLMIAGHNLAILIARGLWKWEVNHRHHPCL